jgi:hypothetical protein
VLSSPSPEPRAPEAGRRSPDNDPNNSLSNLEDTMTQILHHAREEALSYVFFGALIAATFFV